MWLPSPVYERVPQFWLLIGILFMSSGAYLGLKFQLSYLYFGVGFLCVVWSLVTLIMRKRNRGTSADLVAAPTEEDQSDQLRA
jgi:Kef-type K+ transport system membrane component KefB